mmetsp:Transcript_55783/g.148760  ORF Transcript_55783/g.148760 Transcript_55783/m.148760 type:complete len:200 (+) Transcript_55783:277-876(+)
MMSGLIGAQGTSLHCLTHRPPHPLEILARVRDNVRVSFHLVHQSQCMLRLSMMLTSCNGSRVAGSAGQHLRRPHLRQEVESDVPAFSSSIGLRHCFVALLIGQQTKVEHPVKDAQDLLPVATGLHGGAEAAHVSGHTSDLVHHHLQSLRGEHAVRVVKRQAECCQRTCPIARRRARNGSSKLGKKRRVLLEEVHASIKV